jgi:hypothetical protein
LALSLSRSLDRGEPPRGALWRGTASSYAVGSRRRGSAVRAAGCHPRVARRLAVPASACFDPAQHEGRRFFAVTLRSLRPSAAADLPRPSAEEASPDVQTSGVLCRVTGGEGRALLTLASTFFLAVRHAARPRLARSRPRRPPVRDDGAVVTRTPSAGSISCLATGADAHALTFHSSPAHAPHPCHPPRIDPRGQREPPRKAAPLASARPASPRLAFHLAASSSPVRRLRTARSGKDASFQLLQPTTRHEHSTDRANLVVTACADVPSRAPLDGGTPASVRMYTWLRSPGGPAARGLLDL